MNVKKKLNLRGIHSAITTRCSILGILNADFHVM